MSADLRLGDWRNVLADVAEVGAVVADPPYSARTHEGSVYNGGAGAADDSDRRLLTYACWTPADVRSFVDAWAPRNRGWFVCMCDHLLATAYQEAYAANGLAFFAPVTVLIPGMTVRLSGDGPSSWTINVMVARPKRLSKWGTLPGGYTGGPGERVHIGGKPLWLMRALIRDYTKPGDLVCDPCAGAATTLLAAGMENRRAVGAEIDPATHAVAVKRLAAGYTPSFDFGGAA